MWERDNVDSDREQCLLPQCLLPGVQRLATEIPYLFVYVYIACTTSHQLIEHYMYLRNERIPSLAVQSTNELRFAQTHNCLNMGWSKDGKLISGWTTYSRMLISQ